MREKPLKDNLNKKPLLIKPLNKPDSPTIISNQPENPRKPNIVRNTQPKQNLQNQNYKNKPSQNFIQDQKIANTNTNPLTKNQGKKPIQLIEKPKNFIKDPKSNESTKKVYNAGDTKQRLNKSNQSPNKPNTKNFNNKIKPPELVGAPIGDKIHNKTQ